MNRTTSPVPAEAEGWLPPEAPLAMPRQILEREAADGVISAILRLIFTPLRG